jgi:CheY-like chemotaxis protein
MKYTAHGEVNLSFTFDESSDTDVTLVITVSDTGRGMTMDQIGRIFDEYLRFNFDADDYVEGSGLGMGITRNLLNLMNGEVTVESELGKGTVFTVRIPQEHTDSDVIGRELAKKLQEFHAESVWRMKKADIKYEPMPYGKILIVDDLETNLFVTEGLMTPYEIPIDTAVSGFQAIDLIKAGNVYDVIFMDHMMPLMGGMETVRIIRDTGYTAPIVALTANAVVGQVDKFLAGGFDDFISKPIDARRLNAILYKYVRDKQPHEVLERARSGVSAPAARAADEGAKPAVRPHLADFFVRDAIKAVPVLQAVIDKKGDYSDEDLSVYTNCTHAMKTAMVNIGEVDIAVIAATLEQAGRDKRSDVIFVETPAFLSKLRVVITKMTPPEGDNVNENISAEDSALLHDELHTVVIACDMFDKKTAKDTILALRQRSWPQAVKKSLALMSECLLSGDFDEVARLAREIVD